MSVTYGFYNSLNGDRKYNATQVSSIFDGIINDGIFMSIGTSLIVTAGSGMVPNIGIGKAWFNHTWTLNDAILPLTVDQSELILDRIDAFVLEVDSTSSARVNSFKYIKGTPSSSPVRPTLVNTETIHQHPLCYISVKKGVTKITQSDITNMVGTSDCPFITGILETIDADALIAQWGSQWNDWTTEQQTEFAAYVSAYHSEVDTFKTTIENELNTFKTSTENDISSFKTTTETDFNTWITGVKNQFSSDIGTFETSSENDFNTWFNSVKDHLTSDAAGSLTTDILNLAGSGRTTENVKQNADNIAANTAAISSIVQEISDLETMLIMGVR